MESAGEVSAPRQGRVWPLVCPLPTSAFPARERHAGREGNGRELTSRRGRRHIAREVADGWVGSRGNDWAGWYGDIPVPWHVRLTPRTREVILTGVNRLGRSQASEKPRYPRFARWPATRLPPCSSPCAAASSSCLQTVCKPGPTAVQVRKNRHTGKAGRFSADCTQRIT